MKGGFYVGRGRWWRRRVGDDGDGAVDDCVGEGGKVGREMPLTPVGVWVRGTSGCNILGKPCYLVAREKQWSSRSISAISILSWRIYLSRYSGRLLFY